MAVNREVENFCQLSFDFNDQHWKNEAPYSPKAFTELTAPSNRPELVTIPTPVSGKIEDVEYAVGQHIFANFSLLTDGRSNAMYGKVVKREKYRDEPDGEPIFGVLTQDNVWIPNLVPNGYLRKR